LYGTWTILREESAGLRGLADLFFIPFLHLSSLFFHLHHPSYIFLLTSSFSLHPSAFILHPSSSSTSLVKVGFVEKVSKILAIFRFNLYLCIIAC
jgi:hypothetical protein